MVYSSSLACANLLNLEADVKELIRAGHSVFHIDIMDGHYVPNLCLNLDIVQTLKKRFDCKVDVHLMVEDPFAYIEACANSGVDWVSFHLNAVKYPYRLIQKIKEHNMKVGIVLNPKERIEELGNLVEIMDFCLLMSIEPGFSGQKFMESVYKKIEQLSEVRKTQGLNYQISVDGGIDVKTGMQCKKLGANILVMGVFSFFNQEISIYDACKKYVRCIEGELDKPV